MQSDSDIADYTVRVAQKWQVGQKDKNNGAVLFVFIEDRKMFIQVGYGLEGTLPDALAKRIIDDEIKPRFKQGDYTGGLAAGVDAMIKATQGEYKGSGRTVQERQSGGGGRNRMPGGFILLIFLAFFILPLIFGRRRGRFYRSGGPIWVSSGWGGGGSGWSGGSSGGFSSGGGSFGGGGAGGSW
jgi:uncharacterized protein